SGTWAGADVVGRHKNLDLCLLWLPRESGSASFLQPVLKQSGVNEGENIFVIGHPQGLRFTLSTGIISRRDQDALQISAPVSPGNSGGPGSAEHGHLIASEASRCERRMSANREKPNCAVRAEEL